MVMHDARYWRRVGGLVATAALVALSAGCTGSDPAPSTSSTVSSTPTTTTPSPTSSAPPTSATSTGTDGIPAAAKAHTTAGAEAFIRYFFGQLNSAWTKPGVEALRGLCDPSSKSCAGYRDTAERLVAERHHYDVSPVELLGVKPSAPADGAEVFSTSAAQTASHIVDGNGVVVETYERKTLRLVIYVRWGHQGWMVQDIKKAA